MRLFIGVIGWLVFFVFFPVLAVLAILLYPIVWLIALPFRLLGICVDSVFTLLKAVLRLPARLLGATSV